MVVRLLHDPQDLSIVCKLKSAIAIKYAKDELSSDKKPIPVKQIKSQPPLLQEILASAAQGHLPIIVVPGASSKARVNILNVEKFFNGSFEEVNPKTMQRPATMPLIIEKVINGQPIKFRVFDDTSRFRKFEWKATVAVIAEGKKWQLQGWPFNSESDLFYSIRGFYLKYLDEPLEQALSQWNLVTLNLKRDSRHQDRGIVGEFWRTLESFLMQPRHRKFSNDKKL